MDTTQRKEGGRSCSLLLGLLSCFWVGLLSTSPLAGGAVFLEVVPCFLLIPVEWCSGLSFCSLPVGVPTLLAGSNKRVSTTIKGSLFSTTVLEGTLSHAIAAPSRMKHCDLQKATRRPSLSSQNLLPNEVVTERVVGAGGGKVARAEASKVEASAQARLAGCFCAIQAQEHPEVQRPSRRRCV